MKCIYCKNDYPLSSWGEHSQNCPDRKRVRSGVVAAEQKPDPPEEVLSATTDFIQIDIDDMSKDQLINYLALEGIEYDPKAKKYKLLKLAKGE